jgi:alpha-glucosidase
MSQINHLFEDPEFNDEPIAWYRDPNIIPNDYSDLEHIHTKDLQATFDHVYYWRKVIDEYAAEKNIKEDILIMTEAYASTYDTMRYIIDPKDGRRGAHMPFNFQLIYLDRNSNANNVKERIFEYMDNKPDGESANWVMSSHDHSRMGSRQGGETIFAYNTLVLTLPGASISYYVSC